MSSKMNVLNIHDSRHASFLQLFYCDKVRGRSHFREERLLLAQSPGKIVSYEEEGGGSLIRDGRNDDVNM